MACENFYILLFKEKSKQIHKANRRDLTALIPYKRVY
jgi:hypothetical protein